MNSAKLSKGGILAVRAHTPNTSSAKGSLLSFAFTPTHCVPGTPRSSSWTEEMAYPPSPTRQAEAYELSSYPPALAGPSTPTSRPRRLSGPGHSRPSGSSHRPRSVRTLTLQNTDASANVLFSAPHSSGLAGTTPTSKRPAGGRRRTISLQGSPGSPHRGAWANFLNEDTVPRDTVGYEDGGGGGTPGRTEEVHVPDFGHMLGFNPEEEDHYTVARGIKAEWRKRLYLLMEEPRSGREAFFVHIFVTGAILFR